MVFKKEESSDEENGVRAEQWYDRLGGDEWQCGFHEEFRV